MSYFVYIIHSVYPNMVISTPGLLTEKLLSFAKARFNSGERPVLRITTLGLFLLNALAKYGSLDFRLVILYSRPIVSILRRNPIVKTPFLLVVSLQSMITVLYPAKRWRNLSIVASLMSVGD